MKNVVVCVVYIMVVYGAHGLGPGPCYGHGLMSRAQAHNLGLGHRAYNIYHHNIYHIYHHILHHIYPSGWGTTRPMCLGCRQQHGHENQTRQKQTKQQKLVDFSQNVTKNVRFDHILIVLILDFGVCPIPLAG